MAMVPITGIFSIAFAVAGLTFAITVMANSAAAAVSPVFFVNCITFLLLFSFFAFSIPAIMLSLAEAGTGMV